MVLEVENAEQADAGSNLGKNMLEAMVLHNEVVTIREQADLISKNKRRMKRPRTSYHGL